MIPRFFNALPVEIKMLEDSKEFFEKGKELVLYYQFYDLDEFFCDCFYVIELCVCVYICIEFF